jgi:hypothetical protein
VQVSDGTRQDTQALTIQVTPVNDNSPIILTDSSQSIAENGTLVTTIRASDADLPAQSLAYAIVGGADAGHFQLAADGTLSFRAAPSVETPGDANADNRYEVGIEVSDGAGGSARLDLVVQVRDINETGVGGLIDADPAGNHVAEGAGAGSPVGITAQARDADPSDSVRYSLDDSAGGRFVIDPESGVVSVAAGAGLDYESAREYAITVRATSSDGSHANLGLAIYLDNLDDTPPNLSFAEIAIEQGAATVLGVPGLSASDVDSDVMSLRFSVVAVSHGYIDYASRPGQAIGGFSFAELVNGEVRFVHDGSGAAPSFEVAVSDGRQSSGPAKALLTFQVTQIATPDTPTPPAVKPATPDPGAPAAPGNDAGGAPAGADEEGRDDGDAALAQDQATLAQPPRRVNQDAALLALPVNAPGFFSELRDSALYGDSARPAPGTTGDTFAAGPILLDALRLQLSQIVVPLGDAGGAGDYLGRGMTLSDQPGGAEERFGVLLDGVKIAGLAFSVGAVWWAVRIGGLMASLFATAPAWRQLDVLPILRHKAELDDAGKWLEEDLATDARGEARADEAHREDAPAERLAETQT